MKKKFLSIALAVCALAATPAFAQTECNTPKKCDKTECNAPQRDFCNKAFEGLNLTDAQKAQLKELNEKRATARMEAAKERKDAKKERKAEARAERQQADSARMAARRAEKQQYLNDVKAIVGPDQYVVFLENIVVNSPDRGPQPQMRKGGPKGRVAVMNNGRQFKGGKKDFRAKANNVKSAAKAVETATK